MKRFNLAVVVLWFIVFGLSLSPANMGGETITLHDRLIYEINSVFGHHLDRSPENEAGEMIPWESSEATQFYLRHTFTTLFAFMIGLNIAFYAGNGDFGKCGKELKRWLNKKPVEQTNWFHHEDDPPVDTKEKMVEETN